MAEIFRFAYPREIFDRAPEPHRLGYLLLGQLWNDSVILTRQLLTARTKPPEGRSDPDMHGQIATEFLNLRLLASRLRLRTHSQNRTVAARATADRKTVGHLS